MADYWQLRVDAPILDGSTGVHCGTKESLRLKHDLSESLSIEHLLESVPGGFQWQRNGIHGGAYGRLVIGGHGMGSEGVIDQTVHRFCPPALGRLPLRSPWNRCGQAATERDAATYPMACTSQIYPKRPRKLDRK